MGHFEVNLFFYRSRDGEYCVRTTIDGKHAWTTEGCVHALIRGVVVGIQKLVIERWMK